MEDKVSVIIRTFNSSKFIKSAIESVLRQDLSPSLYEILVVDNGSTDSTKDILASYGRKVRVISQKGCGYVGLMNYGITHARGSFIILLDSDDTFEPFILREMFKAFEDEKDLGFVYCDYYEKDIEKNKSKVISLKNIFNSVAVGIMFKKDVFKEVGMYDEDLIFPEYDLLIKTMKRFRGRHIPNPLFTYYRHEESLTADKQRVKKGMEQLSARYGRIKGLRDY